MQSLSSDALTTPQRTIMLITIFIRRGASAHLSPLIFFVNSDESPCEDETGRRMHMCVQCGQLLKGTGERARPSTCALTAQSGSSHTSSATACRRAAQLARVGNLALKGWNSHKKKTTFLFSLRKQARTLLQPVYFLIHYTQKPLLLVHKWTSAVPNALPLLSGQRGRDYPAHAK